MNAPVNPVLAAVSAAIAEVLSVVVGFGLLDNQHAGLITVAATAVLNAAFLIANAIHHQAAAKVTVARSEKGTRR